MKTNNSELIQELVINIQHSEGVEKRLLLNKLTPELEAFIWSILRTHGIKQLPQDSFQTAWLGVMQAIETYDASKGTKFLTHCYWQILSSLSKLKIYASRYETGQGTWSLSSLNQIITDTDNVPLQEKLVASDDTATDCVVKTLKESAIQLIEQNYTGTKKLILLKYMQGTRPVDIAAQLGVTRSHVSNTVSKFKQKCRKELT